LAIARSRRPDLVISDILMPTMDGYEFVRQLRADADLATTAVIFCTAHYHEREAHTLAEACGVARVLVKPCKPEQILRSVHEALCNAPGASQASLKAAFSRDHLRLLTDQLSRTSEELRAANARLLALTELNLQLASHSDPHGLLTAVCRGARNLIGAKYAVLTVMNVSGDRSRFYTTSGIPVVDATVCPDISADPLGHVVSKREALRLVGLNGNPRAAGLPEGYPPLSCALAAPVASITTVYGWICLADKIGSAEFNDEDERVLTILGAQVGRIYENGSLYVRVKRQTEQLLHQMGELETGAAELRESDRRFRDLLGGIELISVMLDRKARITYCNEYLLRLTDHKRDDVVGRNWFELFEPSSTGKPHGDIATLVSDGRLAWQHESEIVTRSGDRLTIRWNSTVLRAVSGEVTGIASIGEDTSPMEYRARAV